MTRRRVIVIVSESADLPALPEGMVVEADRYLEGGGALADRRLRVLNLCRSLRYGSKGYYVSLLADARGQAVLPTVETTQVLAEGFGVYRALEEAGVACRPPGEARAKGRARPEETARTLVFLGTAQDPRFRAQGLAAFREAPAPVLRLHLARDAEGEWAVTRVAAVPPHRLPAEAREALARVLRDERRTLRRASAPPSEACRASVAVLFDPADRFAPSSPETLDRLERAAARRNVHLRRIGPDDLERLPEYDALFIRTLTGVTTPAFPFVLRAEALDMPVVDDSASIIRCGNKVFLEELLRREAIPTPRTRIVTAHTPWETVAELGTPLVVKLPDGSFSAAVHRVSGEAEFRARAAEMFAHSPLIIAQEFLRTDFDWRIGVLDGRLLFAARYHMARGHWQIRAEGGGGTERYGRVEAVPRDAAPRDVVETALRAAALIGAGFYGVDLKETPAGPVVIEVNDNPNLDAGYEDAADGAAIYEDLVEFFVRRVEAVTAALPGAEAAPAAPAPARRSARPAAAERHHRPFAVAGMELEYPTVDANLDAAPLVEPAFRLLAGRGTSDVDLGEVGFSNEIADHVFEVKTTAPVASLARAEAVLADGVRRFSAVLREELGGRLMPTGMHPWMDPRRGRLWTRSGLRVYATYAQLFDVRTHGWMNVQAAHLNLPMGRERDAVAMLAAAAMLIPYLPALAASTPVHDGALQPHADARLAWILEHQARIPESCGDLVPETVESLADYRKRILGPMYAALDRMPHTEPIRHEFFNARGAVFKFSRRAMEVRVLDTQECVRMDVAIAVFVRAALKHLTARVAAGKLPPAAHDAMVADFRACIRDGSEARVAAPHLPLPREGDGLVPVRAVLRHLLEPARRAVRRDEAPYLDLVARVIEAGTLSERIRAALAPHAADATAFRAALRRVYRELMDALEANEPWSGRW